MFDAAPDGVVCVDGDGRLRAVNTAAARLLGWREGDRLPADLAADVARCAADPLLVERQVGDVVAEISLVASELDGRRVCTLFVRDRTAARRTERLRDVEHRLARLLVSARTGPEVARSALELLATGLGFDHAELWMPDAHHATLRLTAAWRRRPNSAFADAGRRVVLARGEDLAGLGWQIGEVVCVDDARALEGLVRGPEVAAEDIRGCAAVPIPVGGRVGGVAVLARAGGGPLDADLRQTIHAIGVQMRQFAERRAAERRLAEETVALAAVARATRRLNRSHDVAGVRAAICEAALEVAGAKLAFIATPDPEHGGLVVRSVAPTDTPPGDARRFRPDVPSAVLRAFQTRETVFLPDIADEPGTDVVRARQAGVVSGLLQPILDDDDEPLGVIGIAWESRQATLDSSTRLLVRLLAGEAALALSRAQLVAQLEAAARTDPLTGLVNLRGWEEQLAREVASAGRDGRTLAVALLDLDGFKALNDRVGHDGGNRVLRSCAAAWRGQLREGDLLARLGGDEFAALLPGCEADHAMVLAERLRAATCEVTVSVGIAAWNGRESRTTLMARADAALYAAKAAGRDRVAAG